MHQLHFEWRQLHQLRVWLVGLGWLDYMLVVVVRWVGFRLGVVYSALTLPPGPEAPPD